MPRLNSDYYESNWSPMSPARVFDKTHGLILQRKLLDCISLRVPHWLFCQVLLVGFLLVGLMASTLPIMAQSDLDLPFWPDFPKELRVNPVRVEFISMPYFGASNIGSSKA